jgi:hypothetical protein
VFDRCKPHGATAPLAETSHDGSLFSFLYIAAASCKGSCMRWPQATWQPSRGTCTCCANYMRNKRASRRAGALTKVHKYLCHARHTLTPSRPVTVTVALTVTIEIYAIKCATGVKPHLLARASTLVRAAADVLLVKGHAHPTWLHVCSYDP